MIPALDLDDLVFYAGVNSSRRLARLEFPRRSAREFRFVFRRDGAQVTAPDEVEGKLILKRWGNFGGNMLATGLEWEEEDEVYSFVVDTNTNPINALFPSDRVKQAVLALTVQLYGGEYAAPRFSTPIPVVVAQNYVTGDEGSSGEVSNGVVPRIVAAPESFSSPGLPGDIAPTSTGTWFYTGDGTTHAWTFTMGANEA